jgi:hypothetical protein
MLVGFFGIAWCPCVAPAGRRIARSHRQNEVGFADSVASFIGCSETISNMYPNSFGPVIHTVHKSVCIQSPPLLYSYRLKALLYSKINFLREFITEPQVCAGPASGLTWRWEVFAHGSSNLSIRTRVYFVLQAAKKGAKWGARQTPAASVGCPKVGKCCAD